MKKITDYINSYGSYYIIYQSPAMYYIWCCLFTTRSWNYYFDWIKPPIVGIDLHKTILISPSVIKPSDFFTIITNFCMLRSIFTWMFQFTRLDKPNNYTEKSKPIRRGECNSYHNDNIPIYTNKRRDTNHFCTKVQPKSISCIISYVKWATDDEMENGNYQKLRLVLWLIWRKERNVVLHVVSLK